MSFRLKVDVIRRHRLRADNCSPICDIIKGNLPREVIHLGPPFPPVIHFVRWGEN